MAQLTVRPGAGAALERPAGLRRQAP